MDHTPPVRGRRALPVRLTAGVALLLLSLTACGSSDDDASAPRKSSPAATGTSAVDAGTSTDIDLSGVELKVATYPVAVGSDETLLKAAGLDDTPYKLSFQSYPDGGTQTSAVIAGTADLSRGSGVANALLAGGDTKPNFMSIATLKISTARQWTVADKSITSFDQLRGKKVAYTPNSTSQYFLLKQLDSVGMTFADIQPVPVSPANGLTALLGGSVVAFAGFGSTVDIAVSKGFPVLGDAGTILKGTLGALVASYNAYKPDLEDEAKSAAIADYIARIDTANAWCRAHADEWNKIVAAATNQPVETVAATFKLSENTVNSSVGPVEPAAIADQQAIADTFLAAGVLKNKVDVASTYTDQLNAAIAADIEKYKTQHPDYFAVTKIS